MAWKKRHKGFLSISHVSTNNCNCCKTNSSSIQKWYINITSCVAPEDFEMFIKEKPSYTWEKLLNKVPKKCYLEIVVFMKQNIDILPNHTPKNYKMELLKGKQVFFRWNYKPLLEQKTKTMKKYIDEYLEKNFIRLSLLAAVTSVLLVRKSSGRLRFYVDYKALNKITMKN